MRFDKCNCGADDCPSTNSPGWKSVIVACVIALAIAIYIVF